MGYYSPFLLSLLSMGLPGLEMEALQVVNTDDVFNYYRLFANWLYSSVDSI